jgi:hypothetical protein
MKFSGLDLLMLDCEGHLDKTGTKGTEIESYFVQFLLTRICAEYESRIAILVHKRCSRTKDIHIKKFNQRGAKEATKNFSIGDLKGILGRFGEDYKTAFSDLVLDKPPHVAWDNIYNNRQAVAHGSGAKMSFDDLKRDYHDSLVVLDSLCTALTLKPKELRDLK